jgi:hypothetical protein
MAEAARIAAEIERGDHSAMSNIHLLEERGMAIDDSQMDEEDRYGAVVRDTASAASAATTNGAGAAAQRPNAWAQGAPRPLLPGAAPSAPIAIDARKEANKLRMQVHEAMACLLLELVHAASYIAAGCAQPASSYIKALSPCVMQMTNAMKQTSPYGTPNAHKRASPLSSPLIRRGNACFLCTSCDVQAS